MYSTLTFSLVAIASVCFDCVYRIQHELCGLSEEHSRKPHVLVSDLNTAMYASMVSLGSCDRLFKTAFIRLAKFNNHEVIEFLHNFLQILLLVVVSEQQTIVNFQRI